MLGLAGPPSSPQAHPANPTWQVLTRQGRDIVTAKACLADRLADITRLSAVGLGRSGLGVVGQLANLRELSLLGGERRRLEAGLQLPELETLRVEGYQIISVRAGLAAVAALGGGPGLWRACRLCCTKRTQVRAVHTCAV